MAVQALTITLGKQEHRRMVDVGTRGVNGDTMRNKILPAVLRDLGIEFKCVKIYSFRYYLGVCISRIMVIDDTGAHFGRVVSTKVMSAEVTKIEEETA